MRRQQAVVRSVLIVLACMLDFGCGLGTAGIAALLGTGSKSSGGDAPEVKADPLARGVKVEGAREDPSMVKISFEVLYGPTTVEFKAYREDATEIVGSTISATPGGTTFVGGMIPVAEDGQTVVWWNAEADLGDRSQLSHYLERGFPHYLELE